MFGETSHFLLLYTYLAEGRLVVVDRPAEDKPLVVAEGNPQVLVADTPLVVGEHSLTVEDREQPVVDKVMDRLVHLRQQ